MTNTKNFIYAILSCLYWFNPLVYFAFAQVRTDAELLCDFTVLTRFKLCSSDYAELLYAAVRGPDTHSGTPSVAPAMSKAGRQLIRRLNFINMRKRRIGVPMRMFSLAIATIITAMCLTNPIAAVKTVDLSGNYIIKYRELLSDSSLEFPVDSARLTVRGFIEAVLLAFDSGELPYEVSRRLQTLRSAGADYLLEEMIKNSYQVLAPRHYSDFVESIEPDDMLTREKAAFSAELPAAAH